MRQFKSHTQASFEGEKSSVALSCRRLAGFNEKSGIYEALKPK